MKLQAHLKRRGLLLDPCFLHQRSCPGASRLRLMREL
jgi:hypothetical protein